MTPHGPAPAPETLLVHTGWMRRLARTLVRDDAQADDVVQDAMAAALRSPPRDAVALPAWLAATVRNGARQLWRGESRRAAREVAAARPEAAPAAAEVVARAEEHGIVVRSVLALDEPYRTALLLRYFDDLPPREVARRIGVPVETARARVRRGVEQLRARLDRAHGGDGRAWRLALAPLALHPKAAAAGSAAAAGETLTTGGTIMASGGVTAAVGGLALVVGIAAGWWSGAAKSDRLAADLAKQAETARAETSSIAAGEDALRQANARLEASQREIAAKLRESEKEVAALRGQLDERTAALAAAPRPAPAAATATKGPRFAFDEYAKLSDVDWKSVGEHLNAMNPLMNEILEALKKGEKLPPEATGNLQRHNGPLVTAALTVSDDIPASGANGSFTHPAFQVNAIAATLDAAGKPLTPEQATALEKVGREFAAEDARRRQGYTDASWALQKTIEEADLRRRFFEAAFAVLTEEQRDALSPPAFRGRVQMDLFSDGLVWIQFLRPVEFKDEAGLTAAVSRALDAGLKVPQEKQDAAKAVVAAWVHALPAAVLQPPADADGPGGGMGRPVSEVRDAAKQTLALLQRLVAEVPLEGKSSDAARKWPVVLEPTFDRE